MQCPCCNRSLVPARLHGVEVELCRTCNGAWFDRAELPAYLNKMGEADHDEKWLYRRWKFSNPLKAGFCPKCNQVAEPTTIGNSGVCVLKCFKCNGMWVQARQLNPLFSWYRLSTPLEKLVLSCGDRDSGAMVSEGGFIAGFLALVIDENPTMKFPWATLGIILVNVAALVWFMIYPERIDSYMLKPERLMSAPLSEVPSLFTSMFLHAGFLHLAGNMYFLFVFGDNIEDRIGVTKFLVFYLTSGLFSGFMYAHLTSHPEIPVLGASGAVSGILGGYLVLYPRARIRSHTMVLFRPFVLRLPVWFYLGLWFLGMQFLSVTMDIPGVAWYAHIAGFIYGAAVMLIMRSFDWL